MNSTPGKPLPKDAHVVTAILKDMGILQYEPRVVQQMLEFIYRYVASVLDDAKVYAGHAKKKNIDLDDVKLAVAMQTERSFTSPPPREILLEIARARNSSPLPTVKPHCGLRLPPDRYCLSSCNYRLKALKKAPVTPASINLPTVRAGMTSASATVVRTVVSRITPGASSNSGYTPRTSTYTPRPSAPRPVIKMNMGGISVPTGNTVSTPMPIIQIAAPSGANSSTPSVVVKTEVKQEPMEESLKRKREDDDYDV